VREKLAKLELDLDLHELQGGEPARLVLLRIAREGGGFLTLLPPKPREVAIDASLSVDNGRDPRSAGD
jgi:hypothetical protein